MNGRGRIPIINLGFQMEREDSGIDSDDANEMLEVSDSGSELEEEYQACRDPDVVRKTNERMIKILAAEAYVPYAMSDHARARQREREQIREADRERERRQVQHDESERSPSEKNIPCENCDLHEERGSPPLFEIELTASDEDDDGSVLELVIPMQTSRYQRVPTSSPIKAVPATPTFFCNLFCCLRK